MSTFQGFPPAVARDLMKSPFYRQIFSQQGLSQAELHDACSLNNVPMTQRIDLVNSAEDFLPRPESVFPIYSTGTSGQPMRVYRDSADEHRRWNLIRRGCALEHKKHLKVLFLCVLEAGLEYRFNEDFGDFSLELVRCNAIKNPERALLLASQPQDLITTSPAGLAWLLKSGIVPTTSQFYSTATSLRPELRKQIENEWNAKIFQVYSTTETGPIAHECRQKPGRYHVFADYFVEAQASKFVVTKLFNSALPLVRYLTGDQAQVHQELCPCGHQGLSLSHLKGRKG